MVLFASQALRFCLLGLAGVLIDLAPAKRGEGGELPSAPVSSRRVVTWRDQRGASHSAKTRISSRADS